LLPIKRLNYGATIYPLSFSQYIVGRFECSGRSATDISGLPTSCGDLLQLGHTLNGFYPIKQVNRRIVKIVYCDFNQSSVEEVSGFTTENEFSQFRTALHELQMQVTTQLKNYLKNVRYLCALFSQTSDIENRISGLNRTQEMKIKIEVSDKLKEFHNVYNRSLVSYWPIFSRI